MKIIFMGSSDFSLPSFKALHEAGYKIQALYTKQPKPKGRGQKLQEHEIYKLAKSLNIPIYTPKSLKSKDAIEEFLKIDADINVVASYGLILPKEVLYAKKYNSINVHGSLLPRWRGAAPIQRAIESGDSTLGVTIMNMDEGIDTGEMLATYSFKLTDELSYTYIFNEIAEKGASLLLNVLQNIENITPQKQDESKACYAKMIKKEEALIDFNASAVDIFNKIRAFSCYPKAYFKINDEIIKVTKACYFNESANEDAKAGTVIDDKITVATSKGLIRFLELQRAGKKAMDAESFLRGFTIKQNTLLQ